MKQAGQLHPLHVGLACFLVEEVKEALLRNDDKLSSLLQMDFSSSVNEIVTIACVTAESVLPLQGQITIALVRNDPLAMGAIRFL